MILLSLKFEISMLLFVLAFFEQPIDFLNFKWYKIDLDTPTIFYRCLMFVCQEN